MEPMRKWLRQELPGLAGLFLLTTMLFAAMQARSPYYFLWDDNVSFYLPSYVHNYETVQDGELPHVNYHQYLGHTHLAAGQTAVLYPPLYPALLLTDLLWGDLRPIIDVLAFGHFLLGALGMFVLLRHLGNGRRAAVLASLLWVSFPFIAQVSRNWIFVAYAAAWIPWSLWLLERLFQLPKSATRIVALGAVKAVLISQGYVQYAILLVLYETLYVVLRWLFGRAERSRILDEGRGWVLSLLACGLLAAPVLLPMFHAKQISAYRSGGLSFQELTSLSMEIWAFVKAQFFSMTPRAVHETSASIFYIGLPNLLVLAALWRQRVRQTASYLCVAVTALVLSTAAYGIMFYVPLLSSFRWPFKSFLFVLFFLTPALAAAYDRLFNDERAWMRRLGAVAAVLALAGNVAVLLTPSWNIPFGPNRVEESVASLRQKAAERYPLENGRVISMWMNPSEPEIHRYLVFNHATLVGAYHMGGYDPLISAEHLQLAINLEYSNIFRYELDPKGLEYLSSWSVRFMMVPEKPELQKVLARFPSLRLMHRANGLEVYENAGALPFAYFLDPSAPGGLTPVDVDWGASGLRLATGGRGGTLRLNVAPLPWYVWSADDERMGPVVYDEQRHPVLDVPPGTQEVEMRYVDVPFLVGAGIFWIFVLSFGLTTLRRARKRPHSL